MATRRPTLGPGGQSAVDPKKRVRGGAVGLSAGEARLAAATGGAHVAPWARQRAPEDGGLGKVGHGAPGRALGHDVGQPGYAAARRWGWSRSASS